MDHVPTPTDPYHPPLLVPYLADGNPGLAYDGKGFLSFPERQGIDPQALTMGDFQNRTHADLLCFFQSWCFFGLLIEVLGVAGISVTVEDFIRIETDNIESKGQVFVSADKLPWLIREWEKGGRDLTEYQKTDRYALIYKHVRDVAQFVCVSSQYAIDVDGRHFFSDSTAQWEDGPSIGNVVQLSIMILWNYLGCAAVTFYKPKAVNYDVPIGQSAYLKKRMVQAGWCPHEVSSLCDQLVGTACLYYLSSFNRHSLVQNHGSCVTSSHCIYAKLDLETYKTKHATECTNEHACPLLTADKMWSPHISGLVRKHETPLITVRQYGVDQQVEISVVAAEKLYLSGNRIWNRLFNNAATILGIYAGSPYRMNITIPYVCISHVWADGLGNLERNAIPQCQLLRLQRLVNDLYEPVERPVPFWLDTMCVPLRRRFRGTAIVDMAKIYKHADKVLVLDSSLSQASTTDSPPIELHMRIMASSWAQRLWTFHETALARRLHYQFTDRALTRRQLTDLLLQSLRSYDRQHPSHCGSGHLDLNLTYGSEARKIGFSRILQSDPIAREAIFWLKELEKSSSMELERDADRLQAISNPLRWRSTSRPEDETICLAGLLDLTIHQRLFLFGIPHSERMKLLILQLDSVPADIIFVDLPRVLDEEFSWIPISFLSGGFNATMTKSRYAQVTSDGLKLSSPGLLVRGQLASIFENNSAFIQYQNNRFSVIPRSTKSLNWGNYHSLESALILRKPLSYPGTTIAALVIVGAKTGDEIICRFICPVWVIGNDVERDLGDTNRAPVAICENSELERWSIQ